MSKRLYVAGPMTGLPGLNFEAFHTVAGILRREGYEVVNPAELNSDPKAQWAECMRTDIKALVDCDGVALLGGWEHSRGAKLEAHIAEALGMTLRAWDEWVRHARAKGG